MQVNEIKKIYEEKKEVHFKLYSLEYTIKQDNDNVVVFADLYPKVKKQFVSIEDALNNYTVYNESIVDNQNRICDIK